MIGDSEEAQEVQKAIRECFRLRNWCPRIIMHRVFTVNHEYSYATVLDLPIKRRRPRYRAATARS